MSDWEDIFGSASADDVIDGINAQWMAEQERVRSKIEAQEKALEALQLTAFRGSNSLKSELLSRLDAAKEKDLFSTPNGLLKLLPDASAS